jgi:hypothetical protein
MSNTATTTTDLSALADAFVRSDIETVRKELADGNEFDAADYMSDLAQEQGGHWAPLAATLNGYNALVRAVRDIM